jgi:hypothetical protein
MTKELREQYATDENLQARIALHAAFSINPHWDEWLFEREAPGPHVRILDLGCGPARSGEPTASGSIQVGRSRSPTSHPA